jgi:glycosyltransferase involved in cell wall biosynthesis
LTAEVGLVPFQEHVLPIYRALDVFVQASTEPEPFGRSIIEAMATARPVIAARNGGAVELFSEGVTALGFETGSADELAAQMSVLASSEQLRSKLALAARAHVHERFGLPRLGADLRDVYRQLLARAD